MQRLVGLLRRVRERPPSGSASASCAAAASELQEKGRGGLHSAAASGDLARLQRRWWWKRLRINRRDANKQTPLHLACVNGHADVVRFLAEKNCQLNPRDNFKKSPLMKAVERQHKDCVAILLKHGANPNLKGSCGNTALHLAALIPSKSLVELLLEHNADIEAKNDVSLDFGTILMLAATMGNMNLIQLLLRHGADISQEDSMGLTAVHHASLNRCADIDKELQEYVARGRTEECCAEDPAVLASSSSGTATNSPLGTPAPTEAVRILHRGGGVLPAAGAEQEDDFDSSSENKVLSPPEDSVGPREVLDDVLLPATDGHGVCAQPLAEERANGVLPTAAGAEQEEDFDSFSENEVSALEREELLLKKDASTQADSQADRQRRVRQLVQELADALKKKSLAEASLEAKKRYSRDLQEEKLQLQKELDKSKAKLQELKERHSRTECYAESLKNAIKNKERELTTSRNLWGLLVASSGTAAIPELEERIQWLQVGKARLEARAQQQAKTIEALQKDLQTSISARNALEDLITGFQTTWTAKEHQHRQHGSESKEVKKLAEMKCQSEALLDEMRRKNIALKEEHTRLKMLLEGFQTKLMAYAGRKRESQLSFRGEMKNSCSKVANKVGKEESHS